MFAVTPPSPEHSGAVSASRHRHMIPGPAGEKLPALNASIDRSRSFVCASERNHTHTQLKKNSSYEFGKGAWSVMLEQMKKKQKTVNEKALLNVCKLGLMALPRTAGGKIPTKLDCFAVVIVAIERLNGAFALLKDRCAEMHGSIHPLVLKKYGASIDVGSVLVLSQVSVFSPSPHDHFLNITLNNVDIVIPYAVATTDQQFHEQHQYDVSAEKTVSPYLSPSSPNSSILPAKRLRTYPPPLLVSERVVAEPEFDEQQKKMIKNTMQKRAEMKICNAVDDEVCEKDAFFTDMNVNIAENSMFQCEKINGDNEIFDSAQCERQNRKVALEYDKENHVGDNDNGGSNGAMMFDDESLLDI